MWLIVAMATIAIVIAGVATFRLRQRSSSPGAAALRLTLPLPAGLTLGVSPDYPFGLAVAPDSRRIVLPASKSGVEQLWLYDLTTAESQPLAGTESAVLPFWSTDGRAIGFFAAGELRVLTLDDGTVRTLAPAPSPRGGVWHPSGDIIFAADAAQGLSRRRASDGTVAPLTTLDTVPLRTSPGLRLARKSSRCSFWVSSR